VSDATDGVDAMAAIEDAKLPAPQARERPATTEAMAVPGMRRRQIFELGRPDAGRVTCEPEREFH
jgi:hypothetical protein